MHVALYRGEQYPPLGTAAGLLAGFDERNQVGHCLFHDPGTLHDLRQKHLAGTKEVAHHIHTIHEGAFDDLNGMVAQLACRLGILDNIGVDAFDQRMRDALLHRQLTPLQVFRLALAAVTGMVGGNFKQPFGGIVAAVQHHVLDPLAQFCRDFFVNRQLTRVDDAHLQSLANGVEQEHGVDGFADRVVAPKRKRHIGDAA